MSQTMRRSMVVLIAVVMAMTPTLAGSQTPSVQVSASDTRVFLAADTGSAVVTPVPIGAVLEVVAQRGDWYQVRLPKDGSGFDRVGFVQKSKVAEITPPAAPTNAAAASPGPATRSERPTAAVLNFEYGSVERWWSGNWNIGKGVSDLLVEELLQTGQLRLLERKQIEAVLGEQDLSNSDRADVSASQASSLGKVLGAKLLLTGSITQFGSEERNVGGAAGSLAGRFAGGAGARNTTATVGLTVRVIDSTTSEILASVRAEGKSTRRGVLLGSRVGGNFGAINMGSRDFKDTILGEATDRAVKDAATKLQTALNNALR